MIIYMLFVNICIYFIIIKKINMGGEFVKKFIRSIVFDETCDEFLKAQQNVSASIRKLITHFSGEHPGEDVVLWMNQAATLRENAELRKEIKRLKAIIKD